MGDATCPQCASADTYRSRKRGCHVCEDCGAEFQPSRAAVQPRTLFFSYGHDVNEPIVSRLRHDLERRGHTVWMDSARIRTGEDWRRAITDGLLGSSVVLGFLSKHSVRTPGACLDELRIALSLRAGFVQTVLLEDGADVQPPSTVSHIQWLDLSDWRRRMNDDSWDEWYAERFGELCRVVEGDEASTFVGEIAALSTLLGSPTNASKKTALTSRALVRRPWLERAIEEWRLRPTASRGLLVLGAAGSGKSSVVAHHLHYDPSAIGGVFCEWDRADANDIRRVVNSIAVQLAARLPDYRRMLLLHLDRYVTPDRRAAATASDYFEMIVTTPLDQSVDGDRERLLLFVDGLDESEIGHRNLLSEVLAANLPRLPRWIGFVMTSRPEPAVIHSLGAFDTITLDDHGADTSDDIYAYLALNLEPYLAADGRRHEALASITDKSAGSFLYAALFVAAVVDGTIDPLAIDAHPRGIDAFFRSDILRKFPDPPRYDKVRRVLAALAAVQPAPARVLSGALDLSIYELSMLRNALGALVRPVTVAVGQGSVDALGFTHKAVADWLSDPARSGDLAVDAATASKAVARHTLAEAVRWRGHSPATAEREDELVGAYCCQEVGRLLSDAGLYDELEAFLLDPATPLEPFWTSIERFPPHHSFDRLDDYLWEHPDRSTYLTALQREGHQSLLHAVLDRWVLRRGIEGLDTATIDLLVDILHLGGQYDKAIELCDSFLATHGQNDWASDRRLFRLAVRRLHHSMFSRPVGPLLHAALSLLDGPGCDAHVAERGELLFLVGGNLGALQGEPNFALSWTYRARAYALEHGMPDLVLRSSRKLAEILMSEGRLDEAERVLGEVFDEEAPVKTRYQVYATGAWGELQRLKSRPDHARRCFERTRDVAAALGIPMWETHGSLALANLFRTEGLAGDAVPYLEDAAARYADLGLAWGSLTAGIIRLMVDDVLTPDLVRTRRRQEELRMEAAAMGYRYHVRVLDRLAQERTSDVVLQFL